MSKKAKTKKVSQNYLRKMMNEMKSKRGTSSTERKTLATNSDAYRKAKLDQQRIEALKKGVLPEKETCNLKDTHPKTTKRTLQEYNGSASAGAKEFKEPLPKIARIAEDQNPKQPGGLPLGDYGSSSDEEDDEKPQQKREVITEYSLG